MPDPNLQKLNKKNYLTMLENSLGTKMFRNFFVQFKDTGKEMDVLENGEKSCASFASTVLFLNGLIGSVHATVLSTVKDLEESGWLKTENPKQGDVVTWEEQNGNTHIGFYWSATEAISNSQIERVPVKHHLTYNDTRKITAFYTKAD